MRIRFGRRHFSKCACKERKSSGKQTLFFASLFWTSLPLTLGFVVSRSQYKYSNRRYTVTEFGFLFLLASIIPLQTKLSTILAMVCFRYLSSCPIRDGPIHSNLLYIFFPKLGIAFPCTMKWLISKQQTRAMAKISSPNSREVRCENLKFPFDWQLRNEISLKRAQTSQTACPKFCEMLPAPRTNRSGL